MKLDTSTLTKQISQPPPVSVFYKIYIEINILHWLTILGKFYTVPYFPPLLPCPEIFLKIFCLNAHFKVNDDEALTNYLLLFHNLRKG